MRCRTGSQWRAWSSEELCSLLFTQHTILAAEFWTNWSLCIKWSGSPQRRQLPYSSFEVTIKTGDQCGCRLVGQRQPSLVYAMQRKVCSLAYRRNVFRHGQVGVQDDTNVSSSRGWDNVRASHGYRWQSKCAAVGRRHRYNHLRLPAIDTQLSRGHKGKMHTVTRSEVWGKWSRLFTGKLAYSWLSSANRW